MFHLKKCKDARCLQQKLTIDDTLWTAKQQVRNTDCDSSNVIM